MLTLRGLLSLLSDIPPPPRFEVAFWNTGCSQQLRFMPSFVYVARETASNREVRSSVEAATEQAAIAALLNRNMLVLSIQEKVGKQGKTRGGRVGLADLVMFTRQLATMVDAGLAMVQSLQALADQTTNKV